MKVLVINGSPRAKGCTARALEEVMKVLRDEGVETELMQLGAQDIRGCLACGGCRGTHRCVIDDAVNKAADKLRECDGLLVGSPVYYASPNGTLLSFLDRLFHSAASEMYMKVGAAVVSCRRGGAASSFEVLNKYFTRISRACRSCAIWGAIWPSSCARSPRKKRKTASPSWRTRPLPASRTESEGPDGNT